MKRIIALVLCLSMILSCGITAGAVETDDSSSQTTGTVIDVTDYGADPSGKNDSVIAVQKALEAAKEADGPVTLSFPTGEYHFWPEDATVRRIYISNSTTPSSTSEEENAIRTIGILMEEIDDLTLEGNGSTFLFHGKMMSFVAIGCENLTIQNLTYDFVLPAVIDLTVESVDGNTAIVYMPDVFEYEIVDGNDLVFYGERSPKTGNPYWTLSGHPYDQVNEMNTGEIYRVIDGAQTLFENCVSIEELGNQRFLFTYSSTPNAEAGYNIQIKQTIRDNPSILLWESENILLKDIRAMHLHSFGIVGQFSKDITVDNVNVIADERKGTLTAAAADMMQMSGCAGTITVKNCNFSNPQDDPINIHGTFLQIEKVIDSRTITVRYKERETYGFPNYYVGDEVDIVLRSTLNTVATYTVTDVVNPDEDDYTKENRKLITITLDKDLPEEITASTCSNYVVENITYTPDVHITDCVFDQSPVRGVLCTTRGKVVIENSVFRNMNMSSIYISDDANGWYESGYCRDVTIRNNVFELCNSSSINFGPVVNSPDPEDPLHKNVLIEGNTFILKNKTAIQMTGAENVTIRDNTFLTYEDAVSAALTLDNTTVQVGTAVSPKLELDTPTHSASLFSFSCCKNVTIEDNYYGEGLNVRASTSNMSTSQITTDEVAINTNNYIEKALTDAQIYYMSTDESVIAIESSGLVAVSAGKAQVYALVETADGQVFESNRVSVQVVNADGKTLSALEVTAQKDTLTEIGQTLQMSVGAVPSTAEVGAVTWSVSDPTTGGTTDVATIDENGLLTAAAGGIVEVKAETASGISNTMIVSVSLTGDTRLVNVEYEVDGQIVEMTEDSVTVYPSKKMGFCDDTNNPETLFTFDLPEDCEEYEATILLTGDAQATWEETGFGIMKDVDNYVSVSRKNHLGTLLYYEVNTNFSEALRTSKITTPAYLKITKSGNTYAGYYKTESDTDWVKINQVTLNLGSDLKLVFWAAGRNNGAAGNYTWSELTINGVEQKLIGLNTPPTASDAALTLSEEDGSVCASYTYADPDNQSEGSSLVFWYIADEEDGAYRRISGETGAVLDISSYSSKYIKALVVPYDSCGVPGDAIWTDSILLPENEGTDSNTYTGESVDAYLSTLNVGTALSPSFERTTLRYMASADDTTESLPLTAAVEDAGARMTVTVNDEVLAEDVASFNEDITLLSGFNYIYITVLAEDGETETTYRVVVVRPGYQDGTLSDLKINGETIPGFDPDVMDYRITLDEAQDITMEATVSNHRARLLLSDGKTATTEDTATWTPIPGTNTYVAAVRSESYGTYNYYTVDVKVAGLDSADLSSVMLENVSLDQTFSADVTEYTGTTNFTYTNVSIDCADVGAEAVITGNGVTLTSEDGYISGKLPLQVGENTFTVTVNSETESNTYTFTITRNNYVYLSDIDYESGYVGYGNIQLDLETDGLPIRLVGEDGSAVSYEKGMGVHAASELVYNITGEGYTRFQAYVGVDYCQYDISTSPASVTFKVYLNSTSTTPVFNSGEMVRDTPQKLVDIPLDETVERLILVVEKGTNNYSDHCDWADAKLIASTAEGIPATDLILDLESAQLDVWYNTSLQLNAQILPKSTTDKTVTWTSSDPSVATVDENGLVTAVAVGNATITATDASGVWSAQCTVTVSSMGASTVIELIDAIGEVTLDSEEAISVAREAYNLLTDQERDQVTNYGVLEQAELSYNSLIAQTSADRAQEAADQAKAAAEDARSNAEAAKEAAAAAMAAAGEDASAAEEAAKITEAADVMAAAAEAAAEQAQKAAAAAAEAAKNGKIAAAEEAALTAEAAAADAEKAAEAAVFALDAATALQEAQEALAAAEQAKKDAEDAAQSATDDRAEAEQTQKDAEAAKEAAEAAAAEAQLKLQKYYALVELNDYADLAAKEAPASHANAISAAAEEARSALTDAVTAEEIEAALEAGKAAIDSVTCPSEAFTDVAVDGWYHEAVDYMVENGYMNGVSDNRFDINGTLTRAQLVTILYRLAGSPDVEGLSERFNDVTEDQWFYDAVVWAYNNGIVYGTSETTFAPNSATVRQQIVTILYRYTKAEAVEEDCLTSYDDAALVSEYAVEAMNWAIANGIVSGMTESTLAPTTTATRAQIATILQRYLTEA